MLLYYILVHVRRFRLFRVEMACNDWKSRDIDPCLKITSKKPVNNLQNAWKQSAANDLQTNLTGRPFPLDESLFGRTCLNRTIVQPNFEQD